jgi:hypothetical protein
MFHVHDNLVLNVVTELHCSVFKGICFEQSVAKVLNFQFNARKISFEMLLFCVSAFPTNQCSYGNCLQEKFPSKVKPFQL